MTSVVVACCTKYLLTVLTKSSKKANSVDQDQTAPIGVV